MESKPSDFNDFQAPFSSLSDSREELLMDSKIETSVEIDSSQQQLPDLAN